MSEYEKLCDLHARIDKLIAAQVTADDPHFIAWKNSTERLIERHYGTDSTAQKQFRRISFTMQMQGIGETHADFVKHCKNGLETARFMLEDYLEEWEDDSMTKKFDYKRAFVVHGHDETLKSQVARLLEQQGIDAIILHEQPNAGKTIIEKIEHYSDVGAAVILFTPDDTGKANKQTDYKSRARQNVVFEAGYFMGYLGRDKIIPVVTDSTIELPSDLQGVVYTSSDMWQFKVIQELKAIGFDVDMNKVKC